MFFWYFPLNGFTQRSPSAMSSTNCAQIWLNGLFRCLNVFYAACSGEVLVGQEGGPEMEQSSYSHPGQLEEVEGEFFRLYIMFFAHSSGE